MHPMDQMGVSNLEHWTKRKQTRREKHLTEMEQVTLWKRLETRVELFYRKTWDFPPYPLFGMLTIRLFLHWDKLSDLTMEDTTIMKSPSRTGLQGDLVLANHALVQPRRVPSAEHQTQHLEGVDVVMRRFGDVVADGS